MLFYWQPLTIRVIYYRFLTQKNRVGLAPKGAIAGLVLHAKIVILITSTSYDGQLKENSQEVTFNFSPPFFFVAI